MPTHFKRIATLLLLTLSVAPAHAQDESEPPSREPQSRVHESANLENLSREDLEHSNLPNDLVSRPMTWEEYLQATEADPSEAPETPGDETPGETPEDITPISLPGDMASSASTPQHISLPDAEGSVQGMGESFSPVLSAGTGTYSVPIALPAGRAGVQPSLALSYGTSGGNDVVGFGWGMGVPFISRQTDRGLPYYDDRDTWHPDEDRFIYNGGQELVPVDGTDANAFDDNYAPAEFAGWQQYRARNEGGFMRFYRSRPDAGQSRRWVVEGPDGSRLEFGEIATDQLPSDFGTLASGANRSASALESEFDGGEGRIFRWHLTRMSDAHGSTVYYRYKEDQGSRYLQDIHYVSPNSCAAGGDALLQRQCTAPLINYGRRVLIDYEGRDDVFESYGSTWRMALGLRVARILVSAAEGAPGTRSFVRRYHLAYEPNSFHSMLASVQVEGRPQTYDASAGGIVGDRTVSETVSDMPVGPLLPAMTFGYSGVTGAATLPGFGALDGTVHNAGTSPTHSVDEARSDFFDVNSDGLPDLLVTDPARYRTSDGRPAVGVFFNGFSGGRTTPAAAGTFSDPVSVPVPAGLSSVFNLANANVVPMDIDGDGRSDMLHMPRAANYGFFTPVRNGDSDATRPADQDWAFAHLPVRLEAGVTDPRIDLGRDGQHIRAFDVNNDHLIDIVRTTGTVMQTWLNLGWLPGGDGRFGSFSRDIDGTALLSTAPYESCLLQSGTPIDFEDPEVRLADMNGDGIQDIVQIRRGRLRYWPGRGLGLWGVGDASCDRGEGADRYIEVANAPAELNVELAGVYLNDVNQDGVADVVQVRFDEVDVWLSEAGRAFTERAIVTDTPTAPAFAPRVRFVDVDGTGTTDILFGNAGRYQWVDLMGGQRPRLLTSVQNGLGARTTLEYGSSATEYLRDLSEAESCSPGRLDCDRFTWSPLGTACDARLSGGVGDQCHRSGGSPVVSTVVTAVQTSDQLHLVGREETVNRSEYRYHQGYYEGIEQEFRGFGAADVHTTAGVHDTHRTGVSRTWFNQGRRPDAIASDRLADNPYEPLKGREYQTETWDAATGTRLATAHSTLTVRELMTGLDGRVIRYAYVSRTDELRYDTSRGSGTEGTVSLPSVSWQTANVGADPTPAGDDAAALIPVRGLGMIRLRSDTNAVDNHGHVQVATTYGRVHDAGGSDIADDPTIESHTESLRLPNRWLWRQGDSWIQGTMAAADHTFHLWRAGYHQRRGYTLRDVADYDQNGQLLRTMTQANMPSSHPYGMDFGGDPFLSRDENLYTTSGYDDWGNATFACAGYDFYSTGQAIFCQGYGEVDYDAEYGQFPVAERVGRDRSTGTAMLFLSTSGQWDRGLGVLHTVTDPTGAVSSVAYDGFGRTTSVTPPDTACTGLPVQRFEYELAVGGGPISQVTAYADHDCTGTATLEARSYVDGLGRTRASLSPGGSESAWIQSGVTILNQRGSVRRAYQPARVTESDPSPARALRIPGTPYEWAGYDAFDRPRCATSACGQMACTTYHALTTDVCDALDMSGDPVHAGTCTTTRNDGYGRPIDQVLRNRPSAYAPMEYYRLWTDYASDGTVQRLTRAETSSDALRASAAVVGNHQVERWFFYDTVGRRIATTDPDSDAPGCDPHDPLASKTCLWRYLYSRAGHLAAMRDPRGCGQNFYYDRAGRVVAEEYVGCGEAQAESETPSSADDVVPQFAISFGTVVGTVHADVRYFYDDDVPSWATTEVNADAAAGQTMGRLIGVMDRGQRSQMRYDARGQVTWAQREMAVPNVAPTVTVSNQTPGAGLPPVTSETLPAATAITYDDDHLYTRTASYGHGGRALTMTLPEDPDYVGTAPVVGGRIEYNSRGLPSKMVLTRDSSEQVVVESITYDQNGLVTDLVYGDDTDAAGTARAPTSTHSTYDTCLRPIESETTRTPTGGMGRELGLVATPFHQRLVWDPANNLVRVTDLRDAEEWDDGHRPQTVDIFHDALYRVVDAEYTYHQDANAVGPDTSSDWRADHAASAAADPMRPDPAPRMGALPSERVNTLSWQYDWLGNMQRWDDDASSFYERSIGDIENGADRATADRPGALHFASNVRQSGTDVDPGIDRGGWLEVDYGDNGNVLSMHVHARCSDTGSACVDPGEDTPGRGTTLAGVCSCAEEQYYEYRWDELNRIAEARRYDRTGVSWPAAPTVQQRYRYDSANRRTVKETLGDATGSRIALYVYPGDFERRGLIRNAAGDSYLASAALGTETQHLVGGARVVWGAGAVGTELEPSHRVTVGLTDLIQTTAAVLDLRSGELLESSTYYPNGARETYLAQSVVGVAAEPMGFTGKEADSEVGLVYFGERYLIPRIGRWASADPLHVHAVGGGEVGNGFHYVSGNLLAARDPLGLDGTATTAASAGRDTTSPRATSGTSGGEAPAHDFDDGGVQILPISPPDLDAIFPGYGLEPNQIGGSGEPADTALSDASWVVRRRPGEVDQYWFDRGAGEGWTQYDPREWDRGGSAHPDPAGNLIIESVGGGAGGFVIRVAGRVVARVLVGVVDAAGNAATRGVLGAVDEAIVSGAREATEAMVPRLIGPGPSAGTSLPTDSIRFSQSSVNGTAELVRSMRANGWSGPPIDVVQLESGLVAVDNTRVLAAHRAGINVRARVHAATDPIDPELAGRFMSRRGSRPSTWGEAVGNRIGRQSRAYRTHNSEGSWATGSSD